MYWNRKIIIVNEQKVLIHGKLALKHSQTSEFDCLIVLCIKTENNKGLISPDIAISQKSNY